MARSCRWGFLGTADIARKNWQAINCAGNATLQAVASRSNERAEQFIRDLQSLCAFADRPHAVEGYQALIDRDDIDAIYLPIPTAVRVDWATRCVEAGKHVLIEKPAAIDAVALEELIACTEQHGVQLMDGVMFMHSERLGEIRIALGELGPIRHVASAFSFTADDEFLTGDIRVSNDLEPLGCLGDLGWYCVRFFLWLMDWQLPDSIDARLIETTDDGVPLALDAGLCFGKVSASFYCSFVAAPQQRIVISGSDAQMRIDDFVLPFANRPMEFAICRESYTKHGCSFEMKIEEQVRSVDEAPYGRGGQETKMFENFSALALSGEREACWAQYALKTQRVVDAILKSARNAG